jgi:hypothetical protein
MTEYSLHCEIKDLYSKISNPVEVKVDDFIVDLIDEDGLLIKIQAKNLSAVMRARIP